MPPDAVAPSRCRLILVAVLPGTILVLWVLTFLELHEILFQELQGISAIVLGLSGIFLFYIFLYKFQKTCYLNSRHWHMLLLLHGVSVVLLYGIVQWLGHYSPWSTVQFWGTYNLRDACKVFIIGILVVGSISFLGIVWNIYWREDLNASSDPKS
jgi:hypothetical protein